MKVQFTSSSLFFSVTMDETPVTTSLPKKVNPLARGKNKSSAGVTQVILSMDNRRSSVSSDDIEMPVVMKTTLSVPTDCPSSNGLSNEDFDSWLSDSNQRHSPDGIEDIPSLPNNDKTISTFSHDAAAREEQNRNSSNEEASTKEKKHKSSSSKKKEKSKKDNGEKVKKKKSRSKQQHTELEDFFTGTKTAPIDDAYEAL